MVGVDFQSAGKIFNLRQRRFFMVSSAPDGCKIKIGLADAMTRFILTYTITACGFWHTICLDICVCFRYLCHTNSIEYCRQNSVVYYGLCRESGYRGASELCCLGPILRKEAVVLEGALSNVVVLDLTRVLAGPFCSMMMADMGATVIKIENPKGGADERSMGPFKEGVSAYSMNLNRNKKAITLNLKEIVLPFW